MRRLGGFKESHSLKLPQEGGKESRFNYSRQQKGFFSLHKLFVECVIKWSVETCFFFLAYILLIMFKIALFASSECTGC